MNDDDALETRLRSTFQALLDPIEGECPIWGSSPKSAAEIARDGRPGLWGAFGRHPRLAVFGALGLVVVLVASGLFAFTALAFRRSCAGCANPAFWGIAAFDENHLVVVGGTDDWFGKLVVATSDDAGKTWSMAYPDAPALTSLTRAGSRLVGSMGCYTGSNGNPTPSSCLYASDDGGRTWQDLEAGRLVDPSFADASHGVATSYWEPWEKSLSAPQLYATSDGGHSWQVQPDPCGPDYPWLDQVAAVAADTAVVRCSALSEATLLSDWELVRVKLGATSTVIGRYGDHGDLFDNVNIESLVMAPDGVGYVSGTTVTAGQTGVSGSAQGTYDPGVGVYRTTDGGASWKLVGTPPLPLETGAIVSDSVAYFSLREGTGTWTGAVVTRDGGATWSRLVCWPYFGSVC